MRLKQDQEVWPHLKEPKLKENRELTKEEIQESLKPIKRDVNIPEAITVRELSNRMAEQSSNVIKHLFGMGVIQLLSIKH